jgi:hypothetical protein
MTHHLRPTPSYGCVAAPATRNRFAPVTLGELGIASPTGPLQGCRWADRSGKLATHAGDCPQISKLMPGCGQREHKYGPKLRRPSPVNGMSDQ